MWIRLRLSPLQCVKMAAVNGSFRIESSVNAKRYVAPFQPRSMNKWMLLGFAIISEVIATSSLKSTEGFTKLWPSILVLIGYSAAFYFLSLTLDTIPIGVAYAVWSGIGIAGIALVSVLFFDQRLDAAAIIGMGLIVAGVVVLRLFSDASVE